MLIKEAVKWPVERTMAALEWRLLARDREPSFRPIFIVAPARSGSTLLCQAMTRYFELCYFSNAMTRFPESPICLAYLLSPLHGCDPPASFRSDRGHIEGSRGPSDGTKIWSRWFRNEPQYIPDGVLTPRQRREVRSTISWFQDAFAAPFINKTQRNCGRILALAEIFPEALFIRMHRTPFDMVRSRWRIYQSRNDENRLWQSYRPSNACEIVTDDPIEHLCRQVVLTEAEIDRDRQSLDRPVFFDVHYEELCRRPVEILDSFARFYGDGTRGAHLRRRHEIPASFASGGNRDLPPEEAEAIRHHLSRLVRTVPAAKAGIQ